jgi:tRNA threonylcarbamoyladenosine biosynthesis protein TsaE
MKKLEYIIQHESEIRSVITDFFSQTNGCKIFTFSGNLGAGKTTFIKELCKHLHSTDEISSPTYSIVNEYTIPDNKLIFHMDLYRLKSTDEALDAGIDEYLNSEEYCFIEWPEIIANLLPKKIVEIVIEKISDNQRKIIIFIS